MPCETRASLEAKGRTVSAAAGKPKVWRILVGMLLLGIMVATVWLRLSSEKEPVYQGRSLAGWLYRMEDSTRQAECDEAIRHMGTNCLSWLVKWIPYRDRPWVNRLDGVIQKVCPKTVQRAWHNSRWYRNVSGSLFVENSFKTLGEQASPAVPALSNLLQVPDQGTRISASRALAYIGKDGIPPLVAILTNRQALHRDEICYAFASLDATNFAPALPIIGGCLHDSDPPVAQAAQWTLSDQTLHSLSIALAVITNADYAGFVELRTSAVMSLGDNGLDSPEAAVPPLVRAFEDPDPGVRGLATNGVKRIAPEVLKPNKRKRTNEPPPAGSVEDLLLSWSKQARSGLNGAFFDPEAMKGPDAPALQIILRGLGAVPDLIELLDDRRPTARRYETMGG